MNPRVLAATLFAIVAQVVFTMTMITACATAPKSMVQDAYVAEWTLIGAANAVADASATMPVADYVKAKSLILDGNTALGCAKAALKIPGASTPPVCPTLPPGSAGAVGYLQLARDALTQLSVYYASQGQ